MQKVEIIVINIFRIGTIQLNIDLTYTMYNGSLIQKLKPNNFDLLQEIIISGLRWTLAL